MAIASNSGIRTVCGALMAAMGVALGVSGAAADDLVGSEQIGASDAGDPAGMATDGQRLWSRQPGTSGGDGAIGVATDTLGNVYLVGSTGGALGGASKGYSDAWVIKYDGDGRRLWSRQPGTNDSDRATGVASDTLGNVYLVGSTGGALGGANKGDYDAWVIKFDGNGQRLWSGQPGTSYLDDAFGVATDTDGNVYLVGGTEGALGGPSKGGWLADAWVIKFDGNGQRLWSRQPGTSDDDVATGVATDTDGNVYLVGSTGGALGGAFKGYFDAWVIKFDRDGHRLWSRQPGTSGYDIALGVATDTDGNVYVVGVTYGALGGVNKGGSDVWVIKFDGDGHQLWSRQPGTSDDDGAYGVATDTDGSVAVVGVTHGVLNQDQPDAWVIKYDAWVIKFDGDGHQLWSRQPGTSDDDVATGVATDTDGNVAVVGRTRGALGGAFKGYVDAWVIKYAR